MLECWYFIFDIIIAIIGLFFDFYVAPNISVGSIILCVIIISLVLHIFIKRRGD